MHSSEGVGPGAKSSNHLLLLLFTLGREVAALKGTIVLSSLKITFPPRLAVVVYIKTHKINKIKHPVPDVSTALDSLDGISPTSLSSGILGSTERGAKIRKQSLCTHEFIF